MCASLSMQSAPHSTARGEKEQKLTCSRAVVVSGGHHIASTYRHVVLLPTKLRAYGRPVWSSKSDDLHLYYCNPAKKWFLASKYTPTKKKALAYIASTSESPPVGMEMWHLSKTLRAKAGNEKWVQRTLTLAMGEEMSFTQLAKQHGSRLDNAEYINYARSPMYFWYWLSPIIKIIHNLNWKNI